MMMTRSKARGAPAQYTPDSDARDSPRWYRRSFKPGEIVSWLALAAALLSALGFQRISLPALAARITLTEHRVDSLGAQLQFTNYLQCVQLRETHPLLLPPGCAPIIQHGVKP